MQQRTLGRAARGAGLRITYASLVLGTLLWFVPGGQRPTARADDVAAQPEAPDALPERETEVAAESYAAHIAVSEASWRLGEVVDARHWLDSAPVANRGWEWSHLAARSDESLEVIDAKSGPLLALAISPDGQTIATGDEHGAVQLWSTSSRTLLGSLVGHSDAIHSVRFSPDGARLVSASQDHTVRVWDVAKREIVLSFKEHDVPVTSAAFTPDGKRIASCNYERLQGELDPRIEGRVYIWDAALGEANTVLSTLAGGVKPLSSLCFAPDGTHVVAGSWGGRVFEWDLGTDNATAPVELTHPDEGPYNAVNAVDVSPDGGLIACGSKDRTARVWSRATHELVATLRGHKAFVNSVAFSPDGKWLATAGQDSVLILWDTSDWSIRARLNGHRAAVNALAWSPRSRRLYSAGADGTIRAWDPTYTGYEAVIHMRHSAACHAACFTPSGDRLFTCGYNGSVNVWDTANGRRVAFWDAHPGASCNMIDFARDGRRFVSCSWDQTIRAWDPESQAELARINVGDGVYNVAMSPDGTAVSAAYGASISTWRFPGNELVRRFSGHEAPVVELRYSLDGTLLASASSDKTARVWHVDSGLLLATMRGHKGGVSTVDFDRSGAFLVTGSEDGSVRLWSSRSGTLIRTLCDGDDPMYRVRFSPDGTRVAAASQQLILLDVAHGGAVAKFRPHNDTVYNLAFSPDGTRLATCSWDSTITILDTRPIRVRLGLPIPAPPSPDK